MERPGHYKRRTRRQRDDKNSTSPPASPRVVLMRPAANASSQPPPPPQPAVTIATRSQSPRLATAISSENVSAEGHSQNSPSPVQITVHTGSTSNGDEMRQVSPSPVPNVLKLVDGENWTLQEHPIVDQMLADNISSGIKVVAAVGMASCGKSTLLNSLAGKNVFSVHSMDDNLLQAKTVGVDLHITSERMFLLDTQPLLSSALLDEYIKSSQPTTSIANEIAEPETYMYALALQLLSFLFFVCDHVVIVCEWSLDIHLIKLISTALMITGSNVSQINLIWFLKNRVEPEELKVLQQLLDSLIGKGMQLINGSEDELFTAVMTIPSNPSRLSHLADSGQGRNSSEKAWLLNAVRVWDNSIRKSTLYADYARYMP